MFSAPHAQSQCDAVVPDGAARLEGDDGMPCIVPLHPPQMPVAHRVPTPVRTATHSRPLAHDLLCQTGLHLAIPPLLR